MNQIFITNITIEKVRHLRNISIPMSGTYMKPLILTGKNGSGKTSVIEALAEYLENACEDIFFEQKKKQLLDAIQRKNEAIQNVKNKEDILQIESEIYEREERLKRSRAGLDVQFNIDPEKMIRS